MIYLFSPVPGAKTGTANYFGLLIDRLVEHAALREVVRIVVDYDSLEIPVASYRGFDVVDYRSVPGWASAGELRIYFVANNSFHSYVHLCLARLTPGQPGQVISVIHDPACFMIQKDLAFSGTYMMEPGGLRENLTDQYGSQAQKVLDDLGAGNLSGDIEYSTTAQRNTLRNSDQIWVHSRFAALKLFLESAIPASEFPEIKILSHPLYPIKSASARERVIELQSQKPGFRIGAFGWVSHSKRIREVIAGFSLFLDRISPSAAAAVDLVIVGQLPPDGERQLRSLILTHDLTEHVKLIDYAPDDEFSALVRSCDLISNLRFPSCGETSGTLAHGHDAKAVLLTTRYQSFSEEISDYNILPLPQIEIPQVADAIWKCYHNWATEGGRLAVSHEVKQRLENVAPARRTSIFCCNA